MSGHDTTREGKRAPDPTCIAPHGWTADEMTPYFPGVNCIHCGRFVGRDGAINIEYWEMSTVVASLDGECARCLARPEPTR